MLKVKRFVNELMSSNCFIVYDEAIGRCIVVDPGSEKSSEEIDFIQSKQFSLDYIILTHEHTDHTWGVNSLIDRFNAQVVCSRCCSDNVAKESRSYFQFYYNNPSYHYEVKRVDLIVEDIKYVLIWNGITIHFLLTPGHSTGSVCFDIGKYLFTGDTLMEYKPYIPKRNGSIEEYHKSIERIRSEYCDKDVIVCPGHGEITSLRKCIYKNKLL